MKFRHEYGGMLFESNKDAPLSMSLQIFKRESCYVFLSIRSVSIEPILFLILTVFKYIHTKGSLYS
jgi:hypothetical protein